VEKPTVRPRVPHFSSGPTCKRPGWSAGGLSDAAVGRSHRSKAGKAKLKEAIDLTRQVARIPDDYLIGILPGGDTGAFECALWSLLGPRKVTLLAWESFGADWVTDVVKQLKLESTVLEAEYGRICPLEQVDWDTDVVFTWNGTTSGVRMPDDKPPPADRGGLTLCDATSAVYAMPIPWDRLDATTFSWQKCLGGEGAHGVLVLSPRAVERLESYSPNWPMPKIFRLTKAGKLNRAIFEGSTINTPSLLVVEDYLDALRWARDLSFDGKRGLDALIAKSLANLRVIEQWVETTDWAAFLAEDPAIRSQTSVCLKITADWFARLTKDEQSAFCKKVVDLLESEGVAYDCNAYREAPPGFRFWGGPTVDADDLAAALAWLGWAYEQSLPASAS